MFFDRILILMIFAFLYVKTEAMTVAKFDNKEHKSTCLSFDSLLNDIDRKIDGDWEPPGKLLQIPSFNIIYENPLKYIEDIRQSFSDNKLSEAKKMICLYSIQKLDLKNYLELSNYCLELVNEGVLNERVFFFMIFPYEWDTDIRFAKNHKLEGVQKFLKTALKNEKLPWRNSLKNVLDGRMLKDRKKMAKEMVETN